MYNFSIGVILESFHLPLDEALKTAKQLGIKYVQVWATPSYSALYGFDTAKGRKDFLSKLTDNDLAVSAVCGDLGGGFCDPALNAKKIELSKHIIDIALELNTNIVTTHIGVVPSNPQHARYKVMQDACGELALFADSMKAHFAVETGPETSIVLKNFLESLRSVGVAVNLDPANLIMITGDNPVDAVYNLKEYIVHTHAKDGRKIENRDPEIIYGLRPKETQMVGPAYEVTDLGEGDVPFAEYLKALNEIGYQGCLTIERESGDNRVARIKKAADYLRNLL